MVAVLAVGLPGGIPPFGPGPAFAGPSNASIGDLVFNDANGNGTADVGETGVAGVSVTLRGAGKDNVLDTADDTTFAPKTTSAAGTYTFTSLAAGAYRVSATPPTGWSSTNANPRVVTVTSTQVHTAADFGVRQTNASIGDLVFDDADGDGTRDAGEPGLAGVSLSLQQGASTLQTTSSDAAGAYAFTGLAAGTYTVEATSPSGWTGRTPTSVNVTLTAGQAQFSADFGFQQTNASIGDLVWLDADGDGALDAGESALAGVRVTLVETGAQVLTPTSGAYVFANLPRGTYQVAVDGSTLPSGTVVAGASASPTTVVLAAGEVRSDVDFAVRYTGSIGDRVWLDADGDGVQDAGEAGLAGVGVELSTPGPDGILGTLDDVVVASATADASGNYLFPRLAPGDYRVSVDPSSAPDGTASTTTINRNVTLAPHGAVADADFGFRYTGSIGDRVWLDTDADGVQDAGELGLADVPVRLWAPGPDGTRGTADDVSVATVTTDALGLYQFANLAPGAYRVVPESGPTGTAPAPELIDVEVAPHGVVDTADIGFHWTGAIGDVVWLDVDGDGARDAGEPGLAGVRVRLLDAGAEVVTPASGAYGFANLAPGTYRVEVDAGTLPAGTTVAGAATSPATIELAAGQTRNDVDFAVRHTGSIGDRVWLDADADGLQDAGEVGIAGIGVQLSTPGADGLLGTLDDVVAAEATSAADGSYLFPRLAPGDYRVSVTPSSAPAGSAATTPVNVDVTLAPHGAVADADFGFRYTGSIGDRVWSDTDADGIADAGELGVAGVPVRLWAGDNLVATVVTNSIGLYRFDGLASGAYRVDTDPAAAPAGTTANPQQVDVDLAPHGVVETADFGFRHTGSVGDLAWVDRDGDGAFDSGEPGVQGVRLLLFGAGADAALGTEDDIAFGEQTSDGSGAYLFSWLPPGGYRVSADAATVPGGTVPTTSLSRDVTIATGEQAGSADFGFAPYAVATLDVNPAAVTTVAGDGGSANIDGTGTAASFNGYMGGVAVHGSYAFVLTSGFLRKVDLGTGAVSTIAGATTYGCTDAPTGSSVRFANSPGHVATDATHVYSTCTDGSSTYVRRTSIATGATTRLTGGGGGGLVLAGDGFLYNTSGRNVYRIDPNSGALTVFVTVSTSVAGSLGALTADGDALYAIGDNNRVVRIALAGGAVTTAVPPSTTLNGLVGITSAGQYLYVTSTSQNRLARVAKATGAWNVIAGNTSTGAFADGTELDAWFNTPGPLASDGTALYIADDWNRRLRKAVPATAPTRTTPTGTTTLDVNPAAVTTVAGNGTSANVDGVGTAASFNSYMGGVAVHGGSAFVLTSGYLRKVDLATREVTTVAGSATTGCTSSTLGSSVRFGTSPSQIATDGVHVYSICSSDTWSTYLRRTSIATGATTALPGITGSGLVLAADGFLYVSRGRDVHRIDRHTGTTTLWVTVPTTVAGSLGALAADDQALYAIGDNDRVVRIALAGAAVTTVVAASTTLNGLVGITSAGDFLYLTSGSQHRLVRVVKATGTWNVIAGNTSQGTYADGTELDAWFNTPGQLASDGTALYVADDWNRRLRKAVPATAPARAMPTGTTTLDVNPASVTTVAGNGTSGNVDGVGTAATFNGYMGGVAVHGGNAFVLTSGYLRQVDLATRQVTTIAGSSTTGCTEASSGSGVRFGSSPSQIATDGVHVYSICHGGSFETYLRRTTIATGATTRIPGVTGSGLVLGADGYLYVSRGQEVYRIDRLTGSATVWVTVPTATAGGLGALAADDQFLYVLGGSGGLDRVLRISFADGTIDTTVPASAQLSSLAGLVSAGDYLYATSGTDHRLVRIVKATGAWNVIAGNTSQGAFADGTELDAWFSTPGHLASDGTALYIADDWNRRLRKAVPTAAPARTLPTGTTTVDINPAAVTTVAGGASGNVDGTGTAAGFSGYMGGVAVHGTNAFVLTSNYLRKVDLVTRQVTTIAGSATTGCTDASYGSGVRFGSSPSQIATDGAHVYSVCSSGAFDTYLRRTTIATGATTRIPGPGGGNGLTLASDGYLYNIRGNVVYRVHPHTGATTTFATIPSGVATIGGPVAADDQALWMLAGTGSYDRILRMSLADGAFDTIMPSTTGLTGFNAIVSAGAYLYATSSEQHRLVRVTKATGAWTVIAGNTYNGAYAEGTEFDAWFNEPTGIASDGSALYIADGRNYRLRKAVPGTPFVRTVPAAPLETIDIDEGYVATYAGGGAPSSTDGNTLEAGFNAYVNGLAMSGATVFVSTANQLRQIDLTTGAVTTLAGGTTSGCNDSTTGASARFPAWSGQMATDGVHVYAMCSEDSFSTYLRRTSIATGATTRLTGGSGNNVHLAVDGYLYYGRNNVVYASIRTPGGRRRSPRCRPRWPPAWVPWPPTATRCG